MEGGDGGAGGGTGGRGGGGGGGSPAEANIGVMKKPIPKLHNRRRCQPTIDSIDPQSLKSKQEACHALSPNPTNLTLGLGGSGFRV